MARKVTVDVDLKKIVPTLERKAEIQARIAGRLPNEGQKKQPDGHRAKARLVAE
jgi:hypothetical protein